MESHAANLTFGEDNEIPQQQLTALGKQVQALTKQLAELSLQMEHMRNVVHASQPDPFVHSEDAASKCEGKY